MVAGALPVQLRNPVLPGTENVEADWRSRYNLPATVDREPRQLLPAYSFSKKALADIDARFRNQQDGPGIRARLEESFAQGGKEATERMMQIMQEGDKRLNGNFKYHRY